MGKTTLIRLGDVHPEIELPFPDYIVPSLLPTISAAIVGGSLPGITSFEGEGTDAIGRGLRFSWHLGTDIDILPGPAVSGRARFVGHLDYWTINLLRNHPLFQHCGMSGIEAPADWPLDHRPTPTAEPPDRRAKCPRCWSLLEPSRQRRRWCGTCGRHVRPLHLRVGERWQHGGRRFRVVAAENHPLPALPSGFSYESFRHPDVISTRETLALDDVLRPYRRAGEYQQQLALVHWCSSASPSGTPGKPVRPHSNTYHPVVRMIELAQQKGASFYCTYKAIATAQLCTAMGWTARLVNAACGDNRIGKRTYPHIINEIWSNRFGKWYYSDSLMNLHALRDGIPLSCTELRAEFFRNRGRDVTFVWGVDQVPLPYDLHPMNHTQLFEWFVVYMQNNFFDSPPDGGVLYPLLMLRDGHNAGRNWRRDSGDGNVYIGQGNVIETDDPEHIDSPLNVVEILADIEKDTLRLNALTRTPGLKHIQIRTGGRSWRRFQPGETVKFPPGETTIDMRAINIMGVSGPLSTVTIRGDAES